MKTNSTLSILVGGDGIPRYDPITDTYTSSNDVWMPLPCFIDRPRDVTLLEQYGNRDEVDIIARFLTDPMEFSVAMYEGERYDVVERTLSGRKVSVRLRRTTRGGS